MRFILINLCVKMKVSTSIILLLAVCCLQIESKTFFMGRIFNSQPPDDNSNLWFDQILDHFQPTNVAMWKQRYFMLDTYYKPGGPIFLKIGGENTIEYLELLYENMFKYSKEHKAMIFYVEHRYYGHSHPTESMATEELKYLSSEQALADLANFIVAMNSKHNLTGKWISYGGSYSGSLAAWLRQKYPFLVHGSISSSAPLLAKVDFVEYFEVVVKSLAIHSEACVNAIQKAFQQIHEHLSTALGSVRLNQIFKLCHNLEEGNDHELDRATLLNDLAALFSRIVQYSSSQQFNINQTCDIMLNSNLGDEVSRLGEISLQFLDDNSPCRNYKYYSMINRLNQTNWTNDETGIMRSWMYQSCTEFGFFQSPKKESRIFGDNFTTEYYTQQCRDIFGQEFVEKMLNRAVDQTNVVYGALNPRTTNVLYIHGSLDPWHALGLYQSNDPETPTIFINGTSHCADMGMAVDWDPVELKNARLNIGKYIQSLLNPPETN